MKLEDLTLAELLRHDRQLTLQLDKWRRLPSGRTPAGQQQVRLIEEKRAAVDAALTARYQQLRTA